MLSITQLDFSVFKSINDWAGHTPIVDTIMRLLSNDAEYLFYLGVIIYWFTRTDQNRRMVVEALASACVAFGFSMIISHLFYRDRPFVAHTVHLLIDHAANASFPSDHSIGAFVIAGIIWIFRPNEGRIWMMLATLIAFSRIWTGVHYPLDVIAGACIGVGCAAMIHKLFEHTKLLQKGMTAGIGLYEKAESRIWPRR